MGETLELLDREETLLRRRMAELEETCREAEERRERLERYRVVEAGQVAFLEEAERPYVFLEKDFILEKEVDFQLKRLEQRHQDYIQVIGSQCMGAQVDEESLKKGIYNHFSRVFFLTRPACPMTICCPAGSMPGCTTGGNTTVWRSICPRCWLASRPQAGYLRECRWSSTASTPTTPIIRRNMSPNFRCG